MSEPIDTKALRITARLWIHTEFPPAVDLILAAADEIERLRKPPAPAIVALVLVYPAGEFKPIYHGFTDDAAAQAFAASLRGVAEYRIERGVAWVWGAGEGGTT